MDSGVWIVGAVVWIGVCGWLGSWIAGEKGRDSTEGWLLGAFLGPLGILIELLLPTK